MDYQVWTKDEYQDVYTKVDCGDMGAVRQELDKAVRGGREPILTVMVPYELSIKIMEVGSEAKKSQAKPDKSPGAKSNSQVRRGDEAVTQGLSEGGGSNLAGNSPGD